MNEAWLSRWESGQTGWHEANGNRALRKFWPGLQRAGDMSALKNMPPKYRDAGLSKFIEAVWVSTEA